MPKVSVYLPDDLYRAAREQQLSISTLTQRAVEHELRGSATNRWIERVRARPHRVVADFDTSQLLDEARSDFSA